MPPVDLPDVGLSGITSGETLRANADADPRWRESRDMLVLRRVFDECAADKGRVGKKDFLDALQSDFSVQQFVADNPYNLIQPLLLRSMTFTPRDGATTFETASALPGEENRVIEWDDVLAHIEALGGRAAYAKGATEDLSLIHI